MAAVPGKRAKLRLLRLPIPLQQQQKRLEKIQNQALIHLPLDLTRISRRWVLSETMENILVLT